MLKRLTGFPLPSGGAVRLELTTTLEEPSALIVATSSPVAPTDPHDPLLRVIHSGPLRYPSGMLTGPGFHYQVLDLDTASLPDGENVYYHAYDWPGPASRPLTVKVTPQCLRDAVVLLARDILKPRLTYHLDRGLASGAIKLPAGQDIPVLEQEVRIQGEQMPAIYLKESANPNPNYDTVGKLAGQWMDAQDGTAHRDTQHAYSTRLDMLLLCGTPGQRASLEKYLHGVLIQDLDYWQMSGFEAVTISRFDRHDLDPGGVNIYSAELTFECTIYLRIIEQLTYTMSSGDSTHVPGGSEGGDDNLPPRGVPCGGGRP